MRTALLVLILLATLTLTASACVTTYIMMNGKLMHCVQCDGGAMHCV